MTEKFRKFSGQYWLVAILVGVGMPWLLKLLSIGRLHQIVWLLFVADFVIAAIIGWQIRRTERTGWLVWLMPLFCLLGLYLFFPSYVYYLAIVYLGISYLAYGMAGQASQV
ncbi:hypothetical protein [Lactiplantibacillus mudanjiangensis]|uniref:Uncharacterized protein n=1 Tax=Lactiplantibacillus mudanjiangensis TaxID=1296538 RepID=A0A660E918_9LACO|nr:hypothetical protein [Lactiplantibacillus mudanjiangensis]VDG20550.1 hypothetical protein [Lactobacillus sp. CBA3605] [Lactiplantibacillus mudanjiangensis]VDG25703.1 hypothetical protein [Lactobacillus sp. CBA3605] [Lactiplantibacillus mudanjiangensis]VDG30513.1 hypothetical protein [Lactobacillus sp. CBA3605] [Lactiplantibacillus mudanjiangensis]VDG30712.1 hypothetical protein [Lactobacillus sp. CBA3605] [Lactiplantibacillus mudanjiangensis]